MCESEVLFVQDLFIYFLTETGSAITATCVGLGNDLHPPPGMAGKAVPGWNGKEIQVI